MSVMTSKQLTGEINKIKGNAEKLRQAIQEALISCAYYAMKDGNTEPFNQLLAAVGTATRVKGLTTWAETFAPVLVREEKFILNKTAAKSSHVTNEADFAEYEEEMRQVNWWEIVGKEVVVSVFDDARYLEGVIRKLTKEGRSELAEAIRNAELRYRFEQHGVTGGKATEDIHEVTAEPLRVAA